MSTRSGKWAKRAVVPLTIVSISVLALTGCQGGQTSPVASTSVEASTPAAETGSATPTPAATPTLVTKTERPPSGFAPLGHFLVRAGDTDSHPWVNASTDIYVIGHGVETLSGKTLLPGKEVVAESYTSIGSAERPMVAGLIKYRRPATGLDEQKYVTVLVSIDPVKMTVLKQTEVHSEDSESDTISAIGSNGPAVAFTLTRQIDGSYFDTAHTTYGYDAMTGAKIWEQPGHATGSVIGAVVVMDKGKGIIPGSTSDACPKATGVDVVTGKVLYAVDFVDISQHCNDVDLGYSHQSAFITGQAEFQKYIRIEEADVQKSFIAATGTPVTLLDQTLGVDPLTTLVAGNVASPDAAPIVVADARTGETKWTLAADRVQKLNASVLALYDGKLYLQTTDQKPVIDIATGETIDNDTPRYPTGHLDGWTLWSDGNLQKAP